LKAPLKPIKRETGFKVYFSELQLVPLRNGDGIIDEREFLAIMQKGAEAE
jgi:hypothetical protein